MIAIVAAFLAALSAFGVRSDDVDLFQLSVAVFFLAFAVPVAIPTFRRRD